VGSFIKQFFPPPRLLTHFSFSSTNGSVWRAIKNEFFFQFHFAYPVTPLTAVEAQIFADCSARLAWFHVENVERGNLTTKKMKNVEICATHTHTHARYGVVEALNLFMFCQKFLSIVPTADDSPSFNLWDSLFVPLHAISLKAVRLGDKFNLYPSISLASGSRQQAANGDD